MKAPTLPTEWDLLNNIWHTINQQVEEEILLSSDVQDEIEKHIESHTAAHTAALRERVKELEAENTIIHECLTELYNWHDNKVGDIVKEYLNRIDDLAGRN